MDYRQVHQCLSYRQTTGDVLCCAARQCISYVTCACVGAVFSSQEALADGVRCNKVCVCLGLYGRHYVPGHKECSAHHKRSRNAGALQQDLHSADEW